MPISKRTVLRTGFGVIIGILVLSTVTAFQIQESYSRQTAAIHDRYVHQQEILNALRRNMWFAGITARDYFLNTAPDRTSIYIEQINKTREETDTLIRELERMHVASEASRELQARLEDLWVTLTASANGIDSKHHYHFVQQEIVPRRESAAAILRQIEKANTQTLRSSQAEFAATKHSAAQRLLILLGMGLLFGIAVTGFSIRHSEHLEDQAARQFEEVSAAKLELERLSARLMEIQEEERTRLSRELHDEIVQTLAVLKMEILQAESVLNGTGGEIKTHLAHARELAERTVKTVRNISLLLRPSLLDDLGLAPALQWLAQEFSRRTRVPCEFREKDVPEELPEAIKTCVYRVTQEALHNIEKHAHASKVRIRLHRSAAVLGVDIEDDGAGFAVSGRESVLHRAQLGLLGMRERATALGGTLNIDSTQGEGTHIALQLPLQLETEDTTFSLKEAGI